MRLGWIGGRGDVHFEPVPGSPIRLKCRGQVVESSSKVAYEVTIKERGYPAASHTPSPMRLSWWMAGRSSRSPV